MNKEEIKEVVQLIRNSNDSPKVLKQKFKLFYETFPTLFSCVCDKSFDLQYLDWMLEMSMSLNEHSTKKDIERVDGQIYEVLKEKYLPGSNPL